MSLLSYRSHSAVDSPAAEEVTLPGLWFDPRPAIGERGSRRWIERFATAANWLGDVKGGTDVPTEGDEGMSLLAHAFNAMAAQVQAREERLRAALRREQRIASTLQQAFLPLTLPECPGYAFAAGYHPALEEAEVGGDFYDVFSLPDGKIGLLLGDVSGKGLEAAHYATMARYTARAYALQTASPGEVLTRLNQALCDSMDDECRFVTAIYAVLDPATHTLQYAIAGHWPALVARRGGVEVVGEAAMALGIAAEVEYEEASLILEPEDSLVLFTDGLVELGADDPTEEMEHAQRWLDQSQPGSPDQIVEGLYQESRRRAGGRLRDDTTVLAIRREE
jgi:serine phosphatase RsbU (regulator of sigma subunit)